MAKDGGPRREYGVGADVSPKRIVSTGNSPAPACFGRFRINPLEIIFLLQPRGMA
jgi:hypothetical protein